MSTRLHALGFPAQWTPEMLALMETLASRKSRLVGSAKGNYRVWRSPQGAELWFHYPQRATKAPARMPSSSRAASMQKLPGLPGLGPSKPEAELRPVAVTPFHRGLSSCTIKIGRYLAHDRANPLEGSCMAWLPSAAPDAQEQVLVLELAPYGLQPLRSPPHTTSAQIVCLAHAVWAFRDAASYAGGTPSNRHIQFGTVGPVTEADVPEVNLSYRNSPITLGLATGTVRRSIRHINPETREPYYWLLLETRRGTFDVLANPGQMTGDVSEGHVAQVCGSFLARLAGTPA